MKLFDFLLRRGSRPALRQPLDQPLDKNVVL
jgi:hypothetical protein